MYEYCIHGIFEPGASKGLVWGIQGLGLRVPGPRIQELVFKDIIASNCEVFCCFLRGRGASLSFDREWGGGSVMLDGFCS